MAVLFHAGYRNIDVPSAFDMGEELIIEIGFVTAEIVVRINAYDCVEILLSERHSCCIRFDGDDMPIVKPHLSEKREMLLGFAPEITGIHGEAVFPCHKHGGQPLTASEIADPCAGGYFAVKQQFFAELYGVGPHYHAHEFIGIVFFTELIFHFYSFG